MHSFKKIMKPVLVILVCVLLLKGLDFLLYPCTFMRNDIHAVCTEQFDDIILGTSHGKMNIDPEALSEVTGRSGHNLCVGGEYGIDAYYLARLINEKQKPSRIIYEVDPGYFVSEKEEGNNYLLFYHEFPFSRAKLEYFAASIAKCNFRTILFPWYEYPLKTELSKVKDTAYQKWNKNYDVSYLKGKTQEYHESGFVENYPVDTKKLKKAEPKLFEEEKVNQETMEYLKKLIAYCKEENIEFVAVSTPIPGATLMDYKENFISAWKYFDAFFAEQEVPYYNFNGQYFKAFTHDIAAFTDYDGHMNGRAAFDYSKVLGELLKGRKVEMKTSILEYLEESAGKYPDKTAFAEPDASCTFEELRVTARKAGTALSKYFEPRRPVPVFMEKGVDTIRIFMGAVYAGCFYVLLDTKQPAVRLQQILDTLESDTIVTSEAYLKDLEKLNFSGKVLMVNELLETEEDGAALAAIRAQALDVDPLYGIFTSGSTGIPKGVVVGHRSVIDFIDCFTDLFHFTSEDVIGNQAPWDFDVSVKDIYSGLKTGATVQIIPKQYFSFPAKLLDFLEEREVTSLTWAVSALCIITTLNGFEYKIPKTIKKVLFSGEVMPIKHLNKWRENLPWVTYVNIYGPTEITCNCTYYIVDRDFEAGDVLPMGKAFPNEKVFLLDEENHLVTEPGKTGELCVSGTALSLGYYRNPEQTAKVFVQNPLNDRYLEPIYRTGDMAYYNERGELCFAARKDFQIKHMGHRIELGEIEAAMEKVPEIKRSCCMFDNKKNKLVAFYEGDIERRALSRQLSVYLPAFMVPNVFRQKETLPVTKNGKIDRKALMAEYQEG